MDTLRSLYARRVAMVVAFTSIATLGLVSGVLFAYSPDLAIISELDDYTPGTITRIHARDGQVIGEYATERRVILTYDEIPEVLRNAIIAAEDGDFFSHVGFNIPRIVMTLVSNVLEGDLTAAGGQHHHHAARPQRHAGRPEPRPRKDVATQDRRGPSTRSRSRSAIRSARS